MGYMFTVSVVNASFWNISHWEVTSGHLNQAQVLRPLHSKQVQTGPEVTTLQARIQELTSLSSKESYRA